jgi:hypothetical protein
MAWEEWEQLKSAAAERGAAHTELNQLPADQGPSGTPAVPGEGDQLKSRKATWTKAGHDIRGLRDNIGKALTKLEEGQRGLGKDSGCLTAGAQHDVHASWKRYVTDVGKRCGALADVLEKTGNDQLRTDDAVRAELDRLKTEYQDTPAAGGQNQ